MFDEAEKANKKSPPWEAPGLTRSERVIAFIETLTITAGPLAGTKLEVRDWQRTFLRDLYDPAAEDGTRLVRTAILSMARKNGKTGLLAGLALAHLVGPEAESRGQVISCAVDRKQAAILYDEMVAMVLAHDDLAPRVNILATQKKIVDASTGSTYQALSADFRSMHGLSPTFVVYDECAQSRDRRLWDAVSTAGGARAEPLKVLISTQADSDLHWFSQMVDYGLDVLERRITDRSFVLRLYAAPEKADPWDPETWRLANPALGDFRSDTDMAELANRAKRIPAFEAAFRNLNLNQRIDANERFIPAVEWDACAATVDASDLMGRECYAGLDLGSTSDLTALVLVFPDKAGGFDVLPFFWCPKEKLKEREDTAGVPYWSWSQRGLIEATPGRATDHAYVVRRLGELASDYRIKGIAFDRWRIDGFKRDLGNEGIDVKLVEWGQGFKDMGPAVDALEGLVLQRKLRHGAHPVMLWCCSNVIVARDPAGNRKLDKERSREKIDGIVALTMALGLARKFEEEEEFRPACLSAGPLVLSR
ncbi:MAG: terminase large subunit [Hyphomicrobiaceae bacterium]